MLVERRKEHTPVMPTVAERWEALDDQVSFDDYNYAHFRTKYLVRDARRTVTNRGIQPGEVAPDFELPGSQGEQIRLSDLRSRPALLHFGSFT